MTKQDIIHIDKSTLLTLKQSCDGETPKSTLFQTPHPALTDQLNTTFLNSYFDLCLNCAEISKHLTQIFHMPGDSVLSQEKARFLDTVFQSNHGSQLSLLESALFFYGFPPPLSLVPDKAL